MHWQPLVTSTVSKWRPLSMSSNFQVAAFVFLQWMDSNNEHFVLLGLSLKFFSVVFNKILTTNFILFLKNYFWTCILNLASRLCMKCLHLSFIKEFRHQRQLHHKIEVLIKKSCRIEVFLSSPFMKMVKFCQNNREDGKCCIRDASLCRRNSFMLLQL